MSEKAVLSENPAQTSQVNSKPLQTETEVFAVYGAEPEVQAYAMAKYSRSALSMKESLKELNDQKAEKFLNTFYFQYGHRSIADLAHVALAVEKLSLLAAIALVDEQRWDGQERSTRYQNFQKSGYYTPDFGGNVAAAELYQDAIADLFQHYRSLSEDGVSVPRESHAQARRHEAGRLRTHFARAGLRHHSLLAAARDQYVSGGDRERPYSGDAGVTVAVRSARGDPAPWRAVEARSEPARMESESGPVSRPGKPPSRERRGASERGR